ncbi:FAD:protein FMN transferase [Gammaproteobacteria bacterium]|nr:FAD:protein FMN transferase [Gammaproteobacteria bacterium]
MLSRKLISKLIALCVGLFCVFIAYNSNSNKTYSISGNAYGTSWSIVSSSYIADHHKKNIIKIIDHIDFVASNYKINSEIAIINKQPTNTELYISNDLYNILNIAEDINKLSNGAYNIMLGKVSSKLGFAPDFNMDLIQDKEDGYLLTNDNKLIKQSKNWFDLSSIAKGYAVQLIHEYLITNNLTNHLIDIGGELIVNGSNHSTSWMIGIQDPNSFYDKAIHVIKNNDNFLAIATSGEYRNFKISDNKMITHTIDPKTLLSIDSKILSITIAHEESATQADAMATAFNVIGYPNALNIANDNNIAMMLVIGSEGESELIYSNKWYDLGL